MMPSKSGKPYAYRPSGMAITQSTMKALKCKMLVAELVHALHAQHKHIKCCINKRLLQRRPLITLAGNGRQLNLQRGN